MNTAPSHTTVHQLIVTERVVCGNLKASIVCVKKHGVTIVTDVAGVSYIRIAMQSNKPRKEDTGAYVFPEKHMIFWTLYGFAGVFFLALRYYMSG